MRREVFMPRWFGRGAVICALAACAANAQSRSPVPGDPIVSDTGRIAGTMLDSGIRAYLGIPFAQPPVGDLRWREPVPPQPWTGIYEATALKPDCTQIHGGMPPGAPIDTVRYSEDCLYLYIWTPPAAKAGARLAVVVYIHGGGFTGGAANDIQNTGEDLAKKGVIFVDVGYRLGVFGFYAHPELSKESIHHGSGDWGNLDQVEGLRWIHRNIAAFGGDPANVTIVGHSAGSESLYQLMASPLAHGLFAKMSGWSGADLPPGGRAPQSLAEGEAIGLKLPLSLAAKNIDAKNVAEMRAVAWDKMLPAAISLPGGQGRLATRPVVDGYFLPDLPEKIFKAGKQNDVPLLTSSTQDDLGSATQFYDNVHTLADLKKYGNDAFGDSANEFFRLFPASNDEEARKVALMVSADTGFGVANRDWARDQVLTGKQPVYLAQWAHIPPRAPAGTPGMNGFGIGPTHGTDIVYWLGTWVHETDKVWSDWDRELSDKMQDTLVAFAKTGNPNTNAVKIPRYDPKNERRVVFGDGTIYIDKLDTGQIEFLRAHALRRTAAGGR